MTVTATYKSEITAVETIDGTAAPFAASSDKTITHNGLNTNLTLASNSSQPVTTQVSSEVALVSGAKTLDLTALVGTNSGAISFSGLKVQLAKFKNKSTNANTITLTIGASNGYALLGAGWEITLQPGQEATFFLNEQAPDVGGSAKTIDVTGTGSQVLQMQLVAG